MIIGNKNTGKHSLINSSFQDITKLDEGLDNSKYVYIERLS